MGAGERIGRAGGFVEVDLAGGHHCDEPVGLLGCWRREGGEWERGENSGHNGGAVVDEVKGDEFAEDGGCAGGGGFDFLERADVEGVASPVGEGGGGFEEEGAVEGDYDGAGRLLVRGALPMGRQRTCSRLSNGTNVASAEGCSVCRNFELLASC